MFKRLLMMRRVASAAMAPKLYPGQMLFATKLFRHLHPGQVVIFTYQGRESVKRIERVSHDKLFLVGDNLDISKDSRHFGWVQENDVVGKVFWPKLAK